MSQPLRGPHQFYLTLGSGESGLSLEIKLADLNQDRETDPVELNLYRNNQLLRSAFLEDPNPAPTSAQVEEKALTLALPNLSPGIYKVEIKASQDIVIKEIRNSAGQPSFINRLWPVSAPGPLTIFTDAGYLQVKAFNLASLGEINFAGQPFLVESAYDQFSFFSSSTGAIQAIQLPHDDLILENDGVFGFSAVLINPALEKVDRFFQAELPYKYILADYQAPISQGEWQIASTDFNLKGVYREKGKYSFILSIPGLRASDTPEAYLEIKAIKLEFEGRTLWQKLFD
jgi:hypothetical protein